MLVRAWRKALRTSKGILPRFHLYSRSFSHNGELFVDTWRAASKRFPAKTALEFLDKPTTQLTYCEFGQLVDRTIGYLQSLGVERGDRVALQLSKSLEFVVLHLATLQLGAISLPLNPAFPADELGYYIQDSGSKVLFVMETARTKIDVDKCEELKACIFLQPNSDQLQNLVAAHVRGLCPVLSASDTAVLIYTSGTTGRPKGAELTHGNIAASLAGLHSAWEWQSDDVLLHVLPLYHLHGLLVALHGALHAGASMLFLRDFDPNMVLHYLSGRKCSVFMGVPTMHVRLLAHAHAETKQYDLSHTRLITSGSDRLSNEVFEGFKDTFGYTLLERYGMSETSMLTSNPLRGERRVGSVGLPLPGVKVRIAAGQDEKIGEVQVQGPNVFKGYWRQPEKTAASFTPDGWFRTGDLGYLDHDGYLWLCGRDKDLIISGGANVYPPEVERVLLEHPSVASCAVIGCPDQEWGEKVTAVVVLKVGLSASATDLIAFCRTKLAPFKSPKAIVFRAELPRNSMGKVQKNDLRKTVCGC